MGKRTGKPWEPEVHRIFASENIDGKLIPEAGPKFKTVWARIIRERDYQKLLRLASKNRGNGK